MGSLERLVSQVDPVARRRDLLSAGFDDQDVRQALRARRIYRVRHGWYARAGTAEIVMRVVRIGGVLTGIEALRIRGLYLPRPDRIDVAVPRHASGLRRPGSMRQRLQPSDGVRVHWVAPARGFVPSQAWLATEDDALVVVLHTASRELAVAACDGLLRYRGWSAARLDAAFARAPRRVRAWRGLVDGRADSWGETAVRIRLQDAGLTFEPQVEIPGVGRFDGRVSPGVFIEVDGSQHDESWTGPDGSSFERDHLKDLGLALEGARSIRITYPMFENEWDRCLAGIRVAIEMDARARAARPRRLSRVSARPTRASRKLRIERLASHSGRATRRPLAESPQFSSREPGNPPRVPANPPRRQPAARAPNVRR